jgi:hypothetical protein
MSISALEPWAGATINMLRVVIDDNAYQGSYKYTDTRLRQVLVTAAMYVCQEITFDTTYTIDVIDSTISPDPYTNDDKIFMNMIVLKAACLIDHSNFRQRSFTAGLEAKCGPATMRTLNHLQGFKDLIELGPCNMYEKLKEEQQFGGDALNSVVHFILSPFVGDDFDPISTFNTYYDNQRMVR